MEVIRDVLNTKNEFVKNKSNRPSNEELRKKFVDILFESTNKVGFPEKMFSLRKLVLSEGLPEEDTQQTFSTNLNTSLRCVVWKLLLGAYVVDSSLYISLVKEGPTLSDGKIRNDTFRTFRGDDEFWSKVSEAAMARILNAFVREYFFGRHSQQSGDNSTSSTEATSATQIKPAPHNTDCSVSIVRNNENPLPGDASSHDGYVQGMNILIGPLLFVMPELDAYFAFVKLITRHCPQYVLKNLDGVHAGCALVDRCLLLLDPELHAHITSKISTNIFAFPILMTFFASCKPFQQVLVVWDALFALGVHSSVLFYTAYLMLMRDELLAEHHPYKLQRAVREHPLDGAMLVTCALRLLPFIPEDLFLDIVRHPVEKPASGSGSKKRIGRTGTPRPRSASRASRTATSTIATGASSVVVPSYGEVPVNRTRSGSGSGGAVSLASKSVKKEARGAKGDDGIGLASSTASSKLRVGLLQHSPDNCGVGSGSGSSVRSVSPSPTPSRTQTQNRRFAGMGTISPPSSRKLSHSTTVGTAPLTPSIASIASATVSAGASSAAIHMKSSSNVSKPAWNASTSVSRPSSAGNSRGSLAK